MLKKEPRRRPFGWQYRDKEVPGKAVVETPVVKTAPVVETPAAVEAAPSTEAVPAEPVLSQEQLEARAAEIVPLQTGTPLTAPPKPKNRTNKPEAK